MWCWEKFFCNDKTFNCQRCCVQRNFERSDQEYHSDWSFGCQMLKSGGQCRNEKTIVDGGQIVDSFGYWRYGQTFAIFNKLGELTKTHSTNPSNTILICKILLPKNLKSWKHRFGKVKTPDTNAEKKNNSKKGISSKWRNERQSNPRSFRIIGIFQNTTQLKLT